MIKRTNSITGARLMRFAVRIANSLRSGTRTKREIIDGYIVEGKLLLDKHRFATVIDPPQDVNLWQLEPVSQGLSSQSGDLYTIPSRDFYHPLVKADTSQLAFAKQIAGRLLFAAHDNAPLEGGYWFAISPTSMQNGVVCGALVNTRVSGAGYSPTPIGNSRIRIEAMQAGSKDWSRFSYVAHYMTFTNMVNGPHFLQPVDLEERTDGGEYRGSLQKTVTPPIAWWGDNSLFLLVSSYDTHMVKPWNDDAQSYPSYESSLYAIRLSIAKGSVTASVGHTGIRSWLSDWMNYTTLTMARPWREYEVIEDEDGNEIARFLIGGGVDRATVPNLFEITYKAIRVIEDDNPRYPLGAAVIAATVKTFIPFVYEWDAMDESDKWELPVYDTRVAEKDDSRKGIKFRDFLRGVMGKIDNNEEAIAVLAGIKIVMNGTRLYSVELLQCELLETKKKLEIIDEQEIEIPFEYEHETFSVDYMMDVLNDGTVLTRKKILNRPASVLGISASQRITAGSTFSVADPFYKAYLDNEELELDRKSGVENQAIHYTGAYPLYLSQSIRRYMHTHSCRVSKETTALQWYEPVESNSNASPAVMFTDGERFKVELDEYAQGAIVGVSCPQTEVRDKNGKLKMPAVILATIYKDGQHQAMIRKGPIWPEDDDGRFDSLANPNEPAGIKWWSDPTPLNPARKVNGILICRGSNITKQTYGEFFSDGA